MNIITWNMQGATGFGESKWHTDLRRLFAAGADIIALQECGNLPAIAVPLAAPAWLAGPGAYNTAFVTMNFGTRSRPAYINALWVETDPVGHRVNLAVAYNPASYAVINSILIANPAGGGARPALGLRFPVAAGNLDVYTIHAQSPGGADGPGLVTSIVATGGMFFAAGDYNALPATWAGATPAGAVLCPNNAAVTHPSSGTNLDYAFRNAALGPITGNVMSSFIVSDHYPVAYLL